jgi:hypothetical protein
MTPQMHKSYINYVLALCGDQTLDYREWRLKMGLALNQWAANDDDASDETRSLAASVATQSIRMKYGL